MVADSLESRPDAAHVLRRAVVHMVLLKHAMAQPSPATVALIIQRLGYDAGEAIDREKAKDRDFLQQAGLWDALTEVEQEFMTAPMTQVTFIQLKNVTCLGESLLCLLWALCRLQAIPPYDSQADPQALAQVLPQKPEDFLAGEVRLRDLTEVEKARSTAEHWHWRSRIRELREGGYFETEEGRRQLTIPLEQVIQSSAEQAFKASEAPPPLGGDFPAFGKPYRSLTPEQWVRARAIAQERHRAFNWLCGRAPGNHWGMTPIDT
jgi:hypothetical protein